jgi:uncharacterized membrane protein
MKEWRIEATELSIVVIDVIAFLVIVVGTVDVVVRALRTEIGRLAAIAVIRTFLEFFLGRDVAEVREMQQAAREQAS